MSTIHETQICHVIIGEERAVLRIHEGVLRQTSFFTKHDDAYSQKQKFVKYEPEELGDPEEDESILCLEDISPSDSELDYAAPRDAQATYRLKSRYFYEKHAFSSFASCLNGAPLPKPVHRQDRQNLFRVYALAKLYDVPALQNSVLRELQLVYQTESIVFADLLWLLDGENVSSPLVSYMCRQLSYEWACDAETPQRQREIDDFLSLGRNDAIRKVLMDTISFTRIYKKDNPAIDSISWNVPELGYGQCGEVQNVIFTD